MNPEWIADWLRKHLTDSQLQDLYRKTYDRWTWDSGDDDDRQLLESLDAERENRKLIVDTMYNPLSQLEDIYIPVDLTLTTGGEGTVTVTISNDDNAPNPPSVNILEGPHGKL